MMRTIATGTINLPALREISEKIFPLITKYFFSVFCISLSRMRRRAGRSVSEVIAEITILFISTLPISNPMVKDINRRASRPAIVVRALAETGLTTSLIARSIARSLSLSSFLIAR